MSHLILRTHSSSVSAVLLAVLLACLSSPAHADGDPATDAVPRAIPYQGILEIDGEPVNATGDDAIAIRFALYDGPDAAAPVFSQDRLVEVYRGRFTVTIGPVDDEGRAIEQVVRAADGLLLGMTLLGDPADPADDIELANRQRLMATPYALWTTSAANFTVAADLAVDGDATVGGDLSLTGGTLDLGGGTLTGVAALHGDFQLVGGTLDLGGGALAGLGRIDGDVAVSGTLDAQGGLVVDGQTIEPHYHVSHRGQGATVQLDMTRIARLCGDGDGCSVRIAMRLWNGPTDTGAASRGFLLYYDQPTQRWRSSNDNSGQIGNARREHVFSIFSTCYLTDGRFANFADQGDDAAGFKLLLWNGHRGPDRVCDLTFVD